MGDIGGRLPYIALATSLDDKPGLEISDKGRNVRIYLGKLIAGIISLDLASESGKQDISLSLYSEGGGTLSFKDKRGKERVELALGKDGKPRFTLSDSNEKSRAVLGVTSLEMTSTGAVEERAESSLVLFGKNGKVIWQAP